MSWFVISRFALRALGFCVVSFLIAAQPGFAQTATDVPFMGSEAAPELPASALATTVAPTPNDGFGGEDGIYRILVMGDALAGGLGAGMSRMLLDDPRFEIVNRFNESSGIARREFYDWSEAIPKILATKPFDAAVILIGANDRQSMRDGATRHAFRTPEWTVAYEAQLDRVLGALKTQGIKIYWISLPPMADPAFDADMKFLSELHRAHVSKMAGQFIDVRPFFTAADGSYIDRGADDTGTERKLRSRDGITFFRQGNNRFGQLVVGAIKSLEKQVTSATPAVAAVATPVVQDVLVPVQPAAPIETPLFGQSDSSGNDITFKADSVKSLESEKQVAATGVAAPAQNAKPVIVAAKGSAAERLFTEGTLPPAAAGRFDDYSYVAPVTP